MLTHDLSRLREWATRRRGDRATWGHGDAAMRRQEVVTFTRGGRASASSRRVPASVRRRVFFLAFLSVLPLLLSCGAKPTDPRTVIPGDALVYLETADLAKTLKAITDNPKFQQHAKSIPD